MGAFEQWICARALASSNPWPMDGNEKLPEWAALHGGISHQSPADLEHRGLPQPTSVVLAGFLQVAAQPVHGHEAVPE